MMSSRLLNTEEMCATKLGGRSMNISVCDDREISMGEMSWH
jgi:hypothetical protein